MLGLVSSGGVSLLSGGSDWAQISDLGRGKNPELTARQAGTFLHESMDEESLSAEDSAS